MSAHVSGKPVVLLVLERCVIERRTGCSLIDKRLEQKIDGRGIVEDPVDIRPHASTTGKTSVIPRLGTGQRLDLGLRLGRRLSHVHFVSATFAIIVGHAEHDLSRRLLFREPGHYGQQAEAGQSFDIAFDMIGVAHLEPHHLIAAADAHHRRAVAMGADNGLRHAVAAQLGEIGQRILRAGKQDDIGLAEFVRIIRIK